MCYRYTVVTESYGPDILDKIVRPRRNVDGSLPQNMQVRNVLYDQNNF